MWNTALRLSSRNPKITDNMWFCCHGKNNPAGAFMLVSALCSSLQPPHLAIKIDKATPPHLFALRGFLARQQKKGKSPLRYII